MLAYVTCFLIFVLLVVVTVAAGLNFHWQCLFVIWTGSAVAKDPELIQQLTLDSINGFPSEMVEMVKNSDLESLSIARLRYRAPWDVLRGSFRKGTVAVVGDAMHVLGPFLGQVGSAAIEDAIVLARCFAQKMHGDGGQVTEHKVGEAVDEYVKERRMRLVWLSTQTYLVGLLVKKSPWLVRFACKILMMVFFSDSSAHTRYDCGCL